MTLFFFVILTVAWLVIFFPRVLRARRNSPLPAAELFRKRLDLLAPHPRARAGRWVHLPEDPERAGRNARRRAQARKRRVLAILIAVTLVSLAAAVIWPALWKVHLAGAGLLTFYVVLLVGLRRRREDAISKIKPLPALEFAGGIDGESASGGAR